MPGDLLAKAVAIAQRVHAQQVDKIGAPYILHVMRVMNRGQTLDEKICGVLHDVVEDSPMTFDDLRKEGFPEHIIEAVGEKETARLNKYLKAYRDLTGI